MPAMHVLSDEPLALETVVDADAPRDLACPDDNEPVIGSLEVARAMRRHSFCFFVSSIF